MKNINEYSTDIINKNDIRLNANECTSILSKEELIDILINLQVKELNRYPDSNTINLRKAYGKIIGYDYKKILAGNGSDQLIGTIISIFINKNEKVLTLKPDFSMYDFYTSLNEGQLVKLNIRKSGGYSVESLIALGKKVEPKMIILSNPNNPTGYEISVKEIEKLLSTFKDIKILIDEAYIEFGKESAMSLIDKYDNLYIARTMSKAWGLAALRVGFLVSNEENIKEIEKYMVPYSVSTLSQEIAIKIMDYKELILENVEEIKLERNRLYEKLSQLENKVGKKIKFYKSEANFIFGRSKYKKRLQEAFEEQHIKIRYFTDDSFRISIGTKLENNKVLEVIERVILNLEEIDVRESGAI